MISIILTAYKKIPQLEEAILSVMAQTCSDYELILVDDGSTDGTYDLLKKYESSKVKVIRLEKNSGAGIARKTGIEKASGDYIGFLDYDDLYSPELIKKVTVAITKESPDLLFVGYDWRRTNISPILVKNIIITQGNKTQKYYNNNPCMGNVVVRKELFAKAPYSEFRVQEDVNTLFRLVYYSEKFSVIDEPLYIYQDNPESIMSSLEQKERLISAVLNDLYNIIFCKQHPEYEWEHNNKLMEQIDLNLLSKNADFIYNNFKLKDMYKITMDYYNKNR